ncbi:MAG: hypothetical protein HFJ28_06665 [Clostridia bacterium]|nr:hypothetical protein [Clostridia bacterium]
MKIQGSLIIFSTDNEERKDVRRLKEKKLQILLDEKNNLPTFEITSKLYIKEAAEKKVEKLFLTPKFYIEQLYTWGNPKYYTSNAELTVTYLVIISKNNIQAIPKNLKFYDITIQNEGQENLQNIILNSEHKKIEYTVATTIKRQRENIDYIHKLVGKAPITELTALIIHNGIKRLRNRIENTNIAFSFLEEEFAISELQQIYEIILDKKLISANFRKKIEPMVKKTSKVVKESAYRPANRYTFNEEFIRNWV